MTDASNLPTIPNWVLSGSASGTKPLVTRENAENDENHFWATSLWAAETASPAEVADTVDTGSDMLRGVRRSPMTPGETVYYWLHRDEVIGRHLDGWRRQVWQPRARIWVDYVVRFDTEGIRITPEEARSRGASIAEHMHTRVEGTLYGEAAWLEWEDGQVSGSELAVAELNDLEPPVYGQIRFRGIEEGPIDLTKLEHFVVCAQHLLGEDVSIEGDLPPAKSEEVSVPIRLPPVAERDKAMKDHLATHQLRKARLDAGLTQRALADLVGVEQPHIARWESGVHFPRVDRAVEIASALGTTVEAIWPGEPTRRKP